MKQSARTKPEGEAASARLRIFKNIQETVFLQLLRSKKLKPLSCEEMKSLASAITALTASRDLDRIELSIGSGDKAGGSSITLSWAVEYRDDEIELVGTFSFPLHGLFSLLTRILQAPMGPASIFLGLTVSPSLHADSETARAVVLSKLQGEVEEGEGFQTTIKAKTARDSSKGGHDDEGGDAASTPVFIELQKTATAPPASSPAAPAPVIPLVVRKQPSKAMLAVNASRGSEKDRTAALEKTVNEVMAVTGGSSSLPLVSVKMGASIEPTGELQGNCAFASLFRSSLASGPAVFANIKEEKKACDLARKAIVATMARRLLDERSGEGQNFRDLILAVNLSSDGSTTTRIEPASRKKKGNSEKGEAVEDGSVLPHEWSSAMAYLQGQLCLSASPPTSQQYAGPLELTALASLLKRNIIILAEQGSKDDGAVFLYEGEGGDDQERGPALLLPLVAVNTRRRHMFPLALSLAPSTKEGGAETAVITMAKLEALAQGEKQALGDALKGKAGDAASALALKGLVRREIFEAL